MSDSQEKTDDLIAELAKLMSSDGLPASSASKPAVIKLPPLDEVTAPASRVRIPGMNASANTSAPTPTGESRPVIPPVRIPGMDRPNVANDTAPQPKARQFDFGAPPSKPVIAPEPLDNWQARDAGQPAERNEPQFGQHDAPQQQAEPRPEPPKPAPAEPASAAVIPLHGPTHHAASSATEKADEAHDLIADLIAEAEPAAEAVAAPAVPSARLAPPPQQQRGVSIKPVPLNLKPLQGGQGAAPASVAGRPISAPANPTPKPAAPPPAPVSVEPPSEPTRPLDPMDEIEHLLGEAVRQELIGDRPAAHPREQRIEPVFAPEAETEATPAVEFEPESEPRLVAALRSSAAPRANAPVVPPLTTGFAPRRAGLNKDAEPQVEAAEAAILAAAAAASEDVEPAPVRGRQPKRMKVRPQRSAGLSSGARQYVGIAVAGTLLLASGFGLFWVLGMGRDDPATAPVLTADATPVKVEPVVAPAPTTQASGSVVFDEIDGVRPNAENETLVSRDETEGATVSEVARAVTPIVEADDGEGGLANRKVRTVTVRPDGTIVSGDDAVAGSEVLPVERPNVPEIAGGTLEPSELLSAAVAEAEGAAAAPSDALSALVGESGAATADPIDNTLVASTPPAFDASLVSPVPMPRPSNRAAMVGGSERPAAALEASAPVALAPQPGAAVSSGSGAYVQLASQVTEAEAQKSLRALQSRMAGSLNGVPLEIRRVDVPGKGVRYRVVLPTASFQDATQTCAAIKSGGGDCVAING